MLGKELLMTTKTILPDLVVRGSVIAAHDSTTFQADGSCRPLVKLPADSLIGDEVGLLRNWLSDWLGHHSINLD